MTHLRQYPVGPGHNWRDTSLRAADEIESSVANLRAKVLALISTRENVTTHEVAALLCRPVSSVQPRMSELVAQNQIVDSGIRRINPASGRRAIAWRLPVGQLRLLL